MTLIMPKLGIIMPNLGIAGSRTLKSLSKKRVTSRGRNGRQSGSLADALFTSTQQRIFALVFGQPERSYFVNELVSLTEAGSGAVQRELARLEHSGLVSVTRVGNRKHFQANAGSPLFDELCSIVRKTVGLREPVREALEPLARGISLALIYGSVARESDTSSSDVDLLIVSDELSLEEIYSAIEPAEREIHRSINPTLYTTAEFNGRRQSSNAFLDRVLGGQTIVLIGNLHGD